MIAGSTTAGGHGCLYVLIVVCCEVEGLGTDRSLGQRSLTWCVSVSVCVCVCFSVTECDQVQQLLSTPTVSRYSRLK